MSGPELLTIPQVAEHLGVSRWTAYRLVGDGDLEVTESVDGSTRVTRSAYTAWLDKKAMTPREEVRHMHPDLPQLHAFEDVAATYNWSLRALKEGARAHKFEHTHIGRRRYFTDEQLGKYLASQKVVPAQDQALAAMRDRRDRRRTRQTIRTTAA